jgi:hypothetical protein
MRSLVLKPTSAIAPTAHRTAVLYPVRKYSPSARFDDSLLTELSNVVAYACRLRRERIGMMFIGIDARTAGGSSMTAK